MAEQKSTQLYHAAREAQQKFDYFVAGTAGALFAYVAQTYTPRKLHFGPTALEPLALVFLALAFYFGMKRIESTSRVMRLNQIEISEAEMAGNLTKAISEATGATGYNPESGEIVSLAELPARREAHMRAAAEAERLYKAAVDKGDRFFRLRNVCMYLGFAAIFAAKLLQPYEPRISIP